MIRFFTRYKSLHISLLVTTACVAMFYLLRPLQSLMTFWADYVAAPLKRPLGFLSHLFPFSLAEWWVLAAILLLIFFFVRNLRRKQHKRGERFALSARLYRAILGLIVPLLGIYAAFLWLWGAHYYADSFQDRAEIHAVAVTEDELVRVTALFADGLNETAPLAARDEQGVFAVPIRQIFDESMAAFASIEDEFPFLSGPARRPKPLLISRWMQYTPYIGFYFPFTAEANINTRAPRAQIPAIVLHEFAHQRGVASEKEANFVAILAGIGSDNPIFAYSAYLLGFLYLGNALYSAAPEQFYEIHAGLNDAVLADMAYIRRYHERQHPWAIQITNVLYEQMLRHFGEEDGLLSYSEVVTLLLAHF